MSASAQTGADPEPTGSQQPVAPSHGGVDGDSFPAPFAASLDRLGLRSVANFLLEVCRPFGWLGAQIVFLAQPTLSMFGAGKHSDKLAAWLEQLDKEKSRNL